MRALLAALLLGAAPCRAAEDAPAGETLGSVHALIQRTLREALDWSPDARLYAVLGKGPKSGVLWEEWTLIYGDPKARSGFYTVTFADGVLLARHVLRDGAELRERYWDGKLQNRSTWSNTGRGYYDASLPLSSDFIDSPRLDTILKARGFKLPKDGQFQLELVRRATPPNRFQPTYLLDGTYPPVGDMAPNGYERAVWVVDNLAEAVFLDAASGKLINARPSTALFKGPEDWAVRPKQ